jgi:hypothetical protein
MSYQAALQKIEQAAAEQWEELDLSGIARDFRLYRLSLLNISPIAEIIL